MGKEVIKNKLLRTNPTSMQIKIDFIKKKKKTNPSFEKNNVSIVDYSSVRCYPIFEPK